jgi:hypothetical protein
MIKMKKIEAQLVNLTPNTIKVYDDGLNLIHEIFPSGEYRAKLYVERELVYVLNDDIPINRPIMGPHNVSGIPEPEEGVIYIVSALVAQAAQRPDVVSPDTLPGRDGPIKGPQGVSGIRGFQTWV